MRNLLLQIVDPLAPAGARIYAAFRLAALVTVAGCFVVVEIFVTRIGDERVYRHAFTGHPIWFQPGGWEHKGYPPNIDPILLAGIIFLVLFFIVDVLRWFQGMPINVSRLPSHRLGPSPRRLRPRPTSTGPRRKAARVVRRGATL